MRPVSCGAKCTALALVLSAMLTACGGSSDAAPPLRALAGSDQTVNERATVQLTGAAQDGTSGQAAYVWSVVDASGLTLALSGTNTATASFTAPQVSVDTTVTLRLTVTQGGSSASDDVSVVIKPVTDSISLAVLGLGDSVLVTNQPTVTIQGVAQADAPLAQVSYSNATNGSSGPASGTTDWSVPVTLTTGDNAITFTATGADGKSISITKTLTYYANLALTTPLTLSVDVAYAGTSATTLVTVGDSLAGNKTLKLLETDATGQVLNELATMVDNGQLPDEIQGDGIFTAAATFSAAEAGQRCFRARITPETGSSYDSEVRCVMVAAPYAAHDINMAVKLADDAQAQLDAAMAGGQSRIAAAEAVVASLQANADIGAAGSSADGGVWWISQAGILGALHPSGISQGQRAALDRKTRARTAERASVQQLAAVHASVKPAPTVPYPASYLHNRAAYTPRADAARHPSTDKRLAQQADENRIQTSAAVIISPYIANPNDTTNSWGLANDDYSVPWQVVTGGNQCQLYAAKEALNNGSANVTVEDFKGLGSYGYIDISTHGDNYYNGLLSLWQDKWGPNGWLTGALSQVGLYSGVVLPQDASGNYVLGLHESDVQAKRIAIAPGGTLVLLPGFFQRYLDALPNSLVALAACRTTYNNSLANVFLSKGAGSVVGYTDYVSSGYAQQTLKTLLEQLRDGKTVKQAYDQAVATHGANDGDADPAQFTLSGAHDLKLTDGTFTNLGFESGTLTPWMREGDGRVISQLGLTTPTSGAHMGIISTGLGYTTESGSIAQVGCLASNAQKLRFNWNYFSEEFLEYCGSKYQDRFLVEMCEMGNAGPNNCKTLFERKVDDLCSSVSPADISFDQGGVYKTGWQTTELDVSAYAGKKVRMRFYASDVGDSIYDTAILLDDITALVVNSP